MKASHISRLKRLENKIRGMRSDQILTVEEIEDQPGVFRAWSDKSKTYSRQELDDFDGTVIMIVRTQAPIPEDRDDSQV